MDQINIKILEDGTLEIKTSAISTGNHMSADQLLKEMETLMGGQVTKEHNPEGKQRAHTHNHAHAH